MPLTSDLKPFYVKTMPGMNSKTEDLELEDANTNLHWASIAQNVRFHEEPGTFSQRNPFTYYNTSSLGSGAVVGGTRFYGSGGTIKTVVAHGDKIYEGNDSTGAFTEIRSLTTSGKRCSFVTYRDILMGFTGYDNIFCYDGSDSVTWELGSCKAVVGGGTGITRTDISYQVTMDTDAYVCGAVSNTIASVTNQSINLTHIPTGPIGTMNRRIYRKSSETGGAYKLVKVISDNTTTTWTDTIPDATTLLAPLSSNIPSVTDDMPLGAIPKIYRERLFFTMDPNNPNRIYYSNPYLPWYIQQTTNLDYMEISPEDGDVIVGIPIRLGSMVCVKKNSIRNLHITSAQSGADPTTWWAEDPISNVGSPAPYSIAETPRGVVFLGWDHWQLYTGAEVVPVFDEFDCEGDILEANYHDVVACYLNSGVFVAPYTDAEGVNQTHDRVMRYDMVRNKLSYDTVPANCVFTQSGDGESGEVFYGLSTGGYVIRAEAGPLTYRLAGKTSAESGTEYNAYVGGTQVTPYIQIGSTTSAVSIPNNICIFWDDVDLSPGPGWTEITTFDGRFVKISTDAVGTTGTVGDTSGGDLTVLNYETYRLFKKNSSTTEYTFPVGSIVLYDQPSDPVGYTNVGSGFYVKIDSTLSGAGTFEAHVDTAAGGSSIDNTTALRFIKKTGEEDTWDGVSNLVYALLYDSSIGNGWTDVASTYTGTFLLAADDGPEIALGGVSDAAIDMIQLSSTSHSYDGAGSWSGGPNSHDGDTGTSMYATLSQEGGSASTLYSDHTFDVPQDIDTIYFKASAYGSGSESNHTETALYYKQFGDTSWTVVPGTSNYSGSTNASADTTYTVNLTNVIAVRGFASGFGNSPGAGSASSASINEIRAYGKYKFVTTRLARKVLGKMQDYNAALETPNTNGIWVSPVLNINAESLNKLYWNESTTGSDDIQLFLRTGATQASVETGTSCTADNTTETFTAASHPLVDGDRVQITAGTLPTGISNTIMYHVVNKTANTFQLSLTAGGSAVAFSSNGATVTFTKWSPEYSISNGEMISNTANDWISYAVVFVAADTTNANPRVYTADGFVVKFTYSQGAGTQEPAVEMIYEFGFRNFADPMADKIFKKLGLVHLAEQGQLTVTWTTDIDETGTFTVDLSTHPKRWESFFHENAFGRHLKLRFYKNDVFSYKMKEVSGIYSPEPIIV